MKKSKVMCIEAFENVSISDQPIAQAEKKIQHRKTVSFKDAPDDTIMIKHLDGLIKRRASAPFMFVERYGAEVSRKISEQLSTVADEVLLIIRTKQPVHEHTERFLKNINDTPFKLSHSLSAILKTKVKNPFSAFSENRAYSIPHLAAKAASYDPYPLMKILNLLAIHQDDAHRKSEIQLVFNQNNNLGDEKIGNTILHTLIKNYNQLSAEPLVAVIALMAATAASFDNVGCDGMSPLHMAIEKGLYEVAVGLIQVGANPNIVDSKNRDCLTLAIKHNPKLIKLLIDAGADLTRVNKHGHMVLEELLQCKDYGSAALVIHKLPQLEVVKIMHKEEPVTCYHSASDFRKEALNNQTIKEALQDKANSFVAKLEIDRTVIHVRGARQE